MDDRPELPAAHTTVIHLVRHGEVHNPHDILYGRLPRFKLTDRGRCQAAAAGALLAQRPLSTIYSSPLLRARQTAAQIAAACGGRRVHTARWLNEVATPFEGRTARELHHRRGNLYAHAQVGPFEQPADILARVQRFIGRCRRRHYNQEVAAVTHGDVIVFTVLWALAAAAVPANKNRLLKLGWAVAYPAHGSITSLYCAAGQPDALPRIAYQAVTL